MLGISGLFSSSNLIKQAKAPIVSDAIMVGDYVGTLGDGEASTYAMRAGNAKIVRVDVLPNFISYLKRGEEVFRHGIIGHCDGKFPVTNPVTNNIYFNPKDNKYYKCKTSFTGTVATPDEVKFEELSLEKIVKNGLVSSVNITGAAKGNGVSNGSGVITVNTTVNYNDITGKPVSLPNPQVLTISLNGTTTEYKGDAAKTVTITAAAIGAQPAGNYSVVGHNHTADDISGLPTTLPNPNNLVIKLNGVSTLTYSGKSAGEINITPSSIGAQPAGSYAQQSHTHDDRYYTESEMNNKLSDIRFNQIRSGEYNTDGTVHPINAPLINNMRGNKTFGLNPSDITIEYSKDGGVTWLDYGASDDMKCRMFNEIGGGEASLGKATTKELNVAQGTKSRLRITIKATNSLRYCGIDKTYIWFSSAGNTTRCSCSTASFAEKDTWVPVWTDKPLNGWSGPNFFNHRMIAFQGPSRTSDTNCYAIRYEFWMTKTSTQYSAAQVININTYGPTTWVTGNTPFVGNDHLYTWDNKFNMLLPAGLEAKGEIKGVVTKAKQDEQGNVIHTTYSKNGHTHQYLPLSGGALTGQLTLTNKYTIVPKDGGLQYVSDTGNKWLIHNNNGTEIGIGYTGADAVNTRVYGNLYANADKMVWHSGNFDPDTKAASSHNHDSVYSKLSHDHNSLYAAKTHDHTGVYQPVGNYALATHNHDTVYAAKSHNHSGVYAPVSHTHVSSGITAMTGYTKAVSVSAIAATDSLNVAIGKLEKALDGKAPTGNYSVVGHNHNETYNTKAEITNLLAGKLGATANAVSASKLATAKTISVSGAVSGSNTFDGSANMNISVTLNGFDASKITSGTINVDRLPKTALSEFIPVANRAARLALTKTEAQNGDTVKETDTKKMFLVIDDTKLSSDAGYEEYTTVVDWSTITGRPSQFQPVSHTHTWAQISDRPSTLPNPNGLVISLNGKAQTAYTGASAVAFNITPASIGAQVAGSYASSSHNHDSTYAKVSHSHTITQIGALAGYTKAEQVTAISASDTILSAFGKLEKALDGKQAAGSYASASHTHSGVYQPVGNYSLVGHNHDETYSKLSHAHTWDSITGKPGSFTPSTHNQASNTITAMTGYAKASSVSAIGVTDSLNVAIGKLEKALDGKQAAGSYASSSHNHDGVYQPVGSYAAASHNHDTQYAAKTHNHTGVYQPAGSYALSSHNHDGVYAAVSHSHSYLPLSGGTLTGDLITRLNGGIKYLDASGVAKWLMHNNNGTEIGIGYSSSGNNVPVRCYNEIYANGSSKVWHAGNLNPANYASSGHNHDGRYATASHGHAWGDISGKPSTFTPSSHSQAANTITAMTGYSKPSSTGAISTSDTLIAAIGKLERALDGKQASGSYAASNHNHSGVYAPVSHGNHVPAAQSANNKVFLRCDNTWATITPAEIGAQPAGSYAASNHNHNGVYVTTEDSWRFAPKSIGNSSTNTDLNNIVAQGYYVSTSSANKFTNTPDNLMAFELFVTGIGYDSATSYKTQLIKDISNNRYYVRTQTSWTTPVTWTAWSQIAITSDLNSKLSTSGGTVSGALTVTGQILSNADVVAYSDARVKTNVVKIDSALDKVSAINGYTYDMQGVDFKGKRQAGVIAQELKEVLPEAVVTDDNGYYAVRYTNIIPLLIEALKEERFKRENLENEVTNLKEINKTLEERLAKIERMLDIK